MSSSEVYHAELVESSEAALATQSAEFAPAELVGPPPVVGVGVTGAEVVGAPTTGTPATVHRSLWGKIGLAIEAVWDTLFGLCSMTLGLAVLATFPLLQFISLGYLLEVTGRVARSGRLRDGFIGLRPAARLGSMVLGAWLLLWPIRLISDLWYSARLIDPYAPATRVWRLVLVMATVAMAIHLIWACYRGGRLRHFLWPAPIKLLQRLVRGGLYREARDGVWSFLTGMRLGYFFWLGLRGFCGAMLWLVVPVSLFIGAFHLPGPLGVLAGLLGALVFPPVVMILPFLQAQFAAENRFAAFVELREIGRLYLRAPLAFWFSLFLLFLFALPLYLLKIEFLEREVAWLPSLVFVAFIAPARWLTGWALGRARRREKPRFVLSWLTAAPAMIPLALIYVFFVFLSRYTSWYGSFSLFEQHAFLLPVPFLGL